MNYNCSTNQPSPLLAGQRGIPHTTVDRDGEMKMVMVPMPPPAPRAAWSQPVQDAWQAASTSKESTKNRDTEMLVQDANASEPIYMPELNVGTTSSIMQGSSSSTSTSTATADHALHPMVLDAQQLQLVRPRNEACKKGYKIALDASKDIRNSNPNWIADYGTIATAFIDWMSDQRKDVESLSSDDLEKLAEEDYLMGKHPEQERESRDTKNARNTMRTNLDAYLYWQRNKDIKLQTGKILNPTLAQKQALNKNAMHEQAYKDAVKEYCKENSLADVTRRNWGGTVATFLQWASWQALDVEEMDNATLESLALDDYLGKIKHPEKIGETKNERNARNAMRSRLSFYLQWRENGEFPEYS